MTVFVSLGLACASTYTPREPGRISITASTGRAVLVKDGRRYNMGGLSFDVVEAVSDNPVAEAEARAYLRRSRAGMGLFAVGLASFVAGGVAVKNGPGHETRNGVALGLVVTWMASWIASLATLSTAPAHLYDAINIYNDGLKPCSTK